MDSVGWVVALTRLLRYIVYVCIVAWNRQTEDGQCWLGSGPHSAVAVYSVCMYCSLEQADRGWTVLVG